MINETIQEGLLISGFISTIVMIIWILNCPQNIKQTITFKDGNNQFIKIFNGFLMLYLLFCSAYFLIFIIRSLISI